MAGRDALVAQGGLLEIERLGRRAELQIRRTVEPMPDVVQILLDVPERERHSAIVRADRRRGVSVSVDEHVGAVLVVEPVQHPGGNEPATRLVCVLRLLYSR